MDKPNEVEVSTNGMKNWFNDELEEFDKLSDEEKKRVLESLTIEAVN